MDHKENKFLGLIRKGINAKYSLPAWLWVILSAAVGLIVTLIAFFNPAMAVGFFMALPLSGKLIGPAVLLAGVSVMVGMARSKTTYVKWGSFISFCLWVFVGFALFIDGGIISFLLLPLPLLIFWGYKYLASYVREIDGI